MANHREIIIQALVGEAKRQAETFLTEGDCDITTEWALVHREGIKGFDQMTDNELQDEVQERDIQDEVDELTQEAECEEQEALNNEQAYR